MRNALIALFMRKLTITKQHECKQKVRDAEPYCACQLGFCMLGKKNKIYKDATL